MKDDSIVKGGEFKFGGTSVETAGAIDVAIDEERSTNTEGVLKSVTFEEEIQEAQPFQEKEIVEEEPEGYFKVYFVDRIESKYSKKSVSKQVPKTES